MSFGSTENPNKVCGGRAMKTFEPTSNMDPGLSNVRDYRKCIHRFLEP